MSRPSLEAGFKFWHNEVEALERPEMMVPYIPVIALVGIYVATNAAPDRLTSYAWRQAVLANDDAIEGFRKSLSSLFKDRLDDDFDMPIEVLLPAEGAALQTWNAYDSIMDGLPDDVTTIPDNELFIAESLGYARHDHSIGLNPLRLWDQGPVGLRNHYPQTAEFIKDYL